MSRDILSRDIVLFWYYAILRSLRFSKYLYKGIVRGIVSPYGFTKVVYHQDLTMADESLRAQIYQGITKVRESFREHIHQATQECQVRQNYHEETEAGVNKQINLELTSFYTYLSMVC